MEFLDHSLVNARLSNGKLEDPFVEYLSAIHTDYPLDIIVAIGAPRSELRPAISRASLSTGTDGRYSRRPAESNTKS